MNSFSSFKTLFWMPINGSKQKSDQNMKIEWESATGINFRMLLKIGSFEFNGNNWSIKVLVIGILAIVSILL